MIDPLPYNPVASPAEQPKQPTYKVAQAVRAHVRCDQCVWYDPMPSVENYDPTAAHAGGYCHYNPPVFDGDTDNGAFIWPWVRAFDFCGRFLSPANYAGLGDTRVFLRQ